MTRIEGDPGESIRVIGGNRPLDMPEFAERQHGHVDDLTAEEREQLGLPAPNAAIPANLPPEPELEPIVVGPSNELTRSEQLELDVLRESLDDAKAALQRAESAIDVFNARRSVPEKHKQLLVALRGLVDEIEGERVVFDRNVDKRQKEGGR
jgi:hypothetical protein